MDKYEKDLKRWKETVLQPWQQGKLVDEAGKKLSKEAILLTMPRKPETLTEAEQSKVIEALQKLVQELLESRTQMKELHDSQVRLIESLGKKGQIDPETWEFTFTRNGTQLKATAVQIIK